MPTGTVKWFNNAKGFGFILPDAGGDDIFAHYSSIDMDGYRTLKAGQPVTFEVAEGNKGLHATSIKVDSTSTGTPPPAKHDRTASDNSTDESTAAATATPAAEVESAQ